MGAVRPRSELAAAAWDEWQAHVQEIEQFHRAHRQGAGSVASAASAVLGSKPMGPEYDRELALRRHPELTAYLDELERAYRQNREPAVFDHPYLDDILQGLNAADPALAAQRCEFSPRWQASDLATSPLARCLQSHLGTGRTARLLLDSEGHRAALSIRCAAGSNDVSMLLVDSFSPELMKDGTAHWGRALAAIASALQKTLEPDAPPVRVHLTTVGASTQKTLSGCSIFAMSALKKMASEDFVGQLHHETLESMAGEGPAIGVHLVGPDELPVPFMKHATSGTVIDAYLDRSSLAEADAAVNRQGETLRDRHSRHLITRGLFTYSNSFEAKRIEFVRTALHHLTAAVIPEA
ncbi:YopJ family acetyltransferase [Ideonella sp. YS5]|uniref:YopJ family acetyltransferase n=1 Tax=Ideonella sp. YS5 TaxID=3453714 RepID=UPI003EEA4B23